jgi:hypothetical protein
VATKEAVHEDFLDSSSPQEHGKLAMGEGGALDFDLGGVCPFSTFFGAGATPVSNFSINELTTPPPSYWIGLSRPPPAPNWQRFAIERARTRPPPAPNWRGFTRPPPAPNWQNSQGFEPLLFQIPSLLPPAPPKSSNGIQHTVLPLHHRLALSPGLDCAIVHLVVALFLCENMFVFMQRKCIKHIWILCETNNTCGLYRQLQIQIPLICSRSFATRISWLEDPFRSISIMDTSICLDFLDMFHWSYFLWSIFYWSYYGVIKQCQSPLSFVS